MSKIKAIFLRSIKALSVENLRLGSLGENSNVEGSGTTDNPTISREGRQI